MSNKTAVFSVLEYLKRGKIVGAKPPQLSQGETKISNNGSTALRFKSYNPSLSKADFVSIIPERILSLKSDLQNMADEDFHLIKCRDPKFFQFQDDYILLFQDLKSRKKYYQSTLLSRIHNVRVKFSVLPDSDAILQFYSNYAKNLESAFQGHQSYFQSLKHGLPAHNLSENDLFLLQNAIKPIEERSALIWNLPMHFKPHNVMDKFWFYDIKHCFKLYWDSETGKTLHYVAFNDPNDCLKLKRNFHGIYFDDNIQYKLLVETLTGDI